MAQLSATAYTRMLRLPGLLESGPRQFFVED
jgi:hypothetical protein